MKNILLTYFYTKLQRLLLMNRRKKIATIKALQKEYMERLSEKKKTYVKYHSAKRNENILTAKANVDSF